MCKESVVIHFELSQKLFEGAEHNHEIPLVIRGGLLTEIRTRDLSNMN
jgi:hypothetical protein